MATLISAVSQRVQVQLRRPYWLQVCHILPKSSNNHPKCSLKCKISNHLHLAHFPELVFSNHRQSRPYWKCLQKCLCKGIMAIEGSLHSQQSILTLQTLLQKWKIAEQLSFSRQNNMKGELSEQPRTLGRINYILFKLSFESSFWTHQRPQVHAWKKTLSKMIENRSNSSKHP